MEEPNYTTTRQRDSVPTKMPRVYRPPLGAPLRWQDDASGELPRIMLTFFEQKRELTPIEVERVRDYGEYYLDAPMWDANPYIDEEGRAELAGLREQIKAAHTVGDVDRWIHACLAIGIDPY